MQRIVRHFISTHALLPDGGRVTVALSGGADSVALLRVLVALGYEVEAAHCNFHLRGAESEGDERFVRDLCRRLGVRLHVRQFDTRGEARRTGGSIEMAARDLRYEWFASLGMTVAVAHHRDDNAETVLLNLLRGTGLAGLTGMAPSRRLADGQRLIRPLLCVTRQEIEEYLRSLGQEYVTDSTNLGDEARRNVVRHHLLPLMRTLNPSVTDTLCQMADHLRDVQALCDESMAIYIKRCSRDGAIDKAALMRTPAPGTVLFAMLSPLGFGGEQVQSILRERDGEPGRVYESERWRLLRDRDVWLLRDKTERYEVLQPTLPLEGEVRATRDLTLRVTRHPSAGFEIPRDARRACLDLERLTFPLTLRLTREGDRFTPFGMTGSRLVSDYMTDRRRTVFDKERQLVLLSGDEIAWLVGERPSAHFAVTPKTRFVLQITAEKTAR